MYVTLVISLLILSHILTDFYLQNDNLVKKKLNSDPWILWHSSHFLFSSLLLTILFINYYLLLIIVVISITHFFIDKAKIFFDKGKSNLKSFLFFISDQLIHIFIIMAAYPFLHDIKPNYFLNKLLEKFISDYPFLELINNINLLSFIILIIAGLLFSIKGGTILSLLIIKLPQELIEPQIGNNARYVSLAQETAATVEEGIKSENESEKEGMKRYGKVIGNIERILIISAILINQYDVIAIIIAVKSIGRFKELDSKTSDYFIVGNLASFSIAFFIGITLIYAKKLLFA
ncbi:MAG: DUF3307 domain-containing protein [Bacillota bacterium]|nr:DUF3307 domain-containing protein [Bacillota bacterium]